MNKIIPFNKDITFKNNIGEITSIALDDTLKLVEPYIIKGELIVRGCNKIDNEEENFSFPLPVDITIDSKYDTSKCSISIDDFYYEIINDNVLKVKIDLILDDLYYQEEEITKEEVEVVDDRNLLNDLEKTIDEVKETYPKEENNIEDLFKETSSEKEYSIYRVVMVDENDTLNSILEKYHITKEELELYNDLSNLLPGEKIVIPSTDE